MGHIMAKVFGGVVLILIGSLIDARWGIRNIGVNLNSTLDKAIHGTSMVSDSMVSVSTKTISNEGGIDALLEQYGQEDERKNTASASQEHDDEGSGPEERRLGVVLGIYEKAGENGAATNEGPEVEGE